MSTIWSQEKDKPEIQTYYDGSRIENYVREAPRRWATTLVDDKSNVISAAAGPYVKRTAIAKELKTDASLCHKLLAKVLSDLPRDQIDNLFLPDVGPVTSCPEQTLQENSELKQNWIWRPLCNDLQPISSSSSSSSSSSPQSSEKNCSLGIFQRHHVTRNGAPSNPHNSNYWQDREVLLPAPALHVSLQYADGNLLDDLDQIPDKESSEVYKDLKSRDRKVRSSTTDVKPLEDFLNNVKEHKTSPWTLIATSKEDGSPVLKAFLTGSKVDKKLVVEQADFGKRNQNYMCQVLVPHLLKRSSEIDLVMPLPIEHIPEIKRCLSFLSEAESTCLNPSKSEGPSDCSKWSVKLKTP